MARCTPSRAPHPCLFGSRVLGFRGDGSGSRVWASGVSGFRKLGLRIQGLVFRVRDLDFRVEGVGIRV